MLTKKANELALELAGSATTLDDLNGMMRSLMKTAIETMLHSEMSVHLGRGRAAVVAELGPGEDVEKTPGADRPVDLIAFPITIPHGSGGF